MFANTDIYTHNLPIVINVWIQISELLLFKALS